MQKNDGNDARVLSEVPKDSLRELTLEEINVGRKLEPLIRRYEFVPKMFSKAETVEKYWKEEVCRTVDI